MASGELRQLKELHARMQAAVDVVEKLRDEASAVSDELASRRQDVRIQLASLIDMGASKGPQAPDAR